MAGDLLSGCQRRLRGGSRLRLPRCFGALLAGLLIALSGMGCSDDPPAFTATGDVPSTTPATIASAVAVPTHTAAVGPTRTPPQATLAALPGLVQARVVRVIDGDTIEADLALEGRKTVRYIGMDTPESAGGGPVPCFSREATERNRALVLDRTVYMERDVSEVDRFGRLLRYVYLENGDLINEVLVLEGFAEAVAYSPDVRHQQRLAAAQTLARAAGRGLWSACRAAQSTPVPVPTAAPPARDVDAGPGCPAGCTEQIPGCDIKGNINSEGEKIYHVPGGRDYSATLINTDRGERWFCTAQEAVANGWRASQR